MQIGQAISVLMFKSKVKNNFPIFSLMQTNKNHVVSSTNIADEVRMLLILGYALLCPEASKYFLVKLA